MKKALLTALIFIAANSFAQTWVQVPDTNFQAFLTSHYPAGAFMTSGSDFFVDADFPDINNEDSLDISAQNISSIDGVLAFGSLHVFKCASNNLAMLSDLPASLMQLNCQANQLVALPDLPLNMIVLNCRNNLLTSLPVLPSTLAQVLCDFNQLSALPVLPAGLSGLGCSNNSLTVLPDLPSSINVLDCSTNQITVLPELPSALHYFYCLQNALSVIPDLPAALSVIDVANNPLTQPLPVLPGTLTSLGCIGCQLTELPELPSGLQMLNCSSNQFVYLPDLPDNLQSLFCEYNQVPCFPEFPTTLQYIYLNGNPFTCLPNYVAAMDGTLLSYPLCSENDPVNNPNGCQSAMGVQGLVFNDVNNDCVPSGPVLTYVPMSVHDSGNNLIVQSTSLVNGNYYFAAEPGDYSLSVETANLNPSLEVTCPVGNSSSATVTTSNPVVSAGDFGLKCTGFDLGVQSVVHVDLPFPGETHTLEIVAGDLTAQYNAYCAAGIPGTVTIAVSGPGTVTFGGSPTSASGNSATYSIADFGVAGANEFLASILVNTNATSTDEFCISVSVNTAANGDLNASNNSYSYCYHVVNSHDPNIKETYPEQVPGGYHDEFTYTIHFQNTGNAPAMNIRLADILDQNLDLSTLKIVNASADYTYSLNMETRLLSIRFPNIMLADSASDPQGSIGFVQYRIKPLENLVLGTVIDNTCHIYFDYNAPITTNTSHNLYSELGFDEVALNQLKLYPNPAKNQVTLESEELIEQMELYSLNGTKVMTVKTNSKKAQVDVSSLQNGVYLVKVQTQSGIVNKRLVIGQ